MACTARQQTQEKERQLRCRASMATPRGATPLPLTASRDGLCRTLPQSPVGPCLSHPLLRPGSVCIVKRSSAWHISMPLLSHMRMSYELCRELVCIACAPTRTQGTAPHTLVTITMCQHTRENTIVTITTCASEKVESRT